MRKPARKKKRPSLADLGISADSPATVSVRIEARVNIEGLYSTASVSAEHTLQCRSLQEALSAAAEIAAKKSRLVVRKQLPAELRYVTKMAQEAAGGYDGSDE